MRAALSEEAAVEGSELVLLGRDDRPGLEIDVGEPEAAAMPDLLVPEDGARADVVHSPALRVAEQLPAIPQIFEEAVAIGADCRPARLPFAGEDVDLRRDEVELRAAVEHRIGRALRGFRIALVAGEPAERSPFGQIGRD